MPLMELKLPLLKGVQDPVIFLIVDGNYMKYNGISLFDFDFLRDSKSSFTHIAQTHLLTLNNSNKFSYFPFVCSRRFTVHNLVYISQLVGVPTSLIFSHWVP